MRANTSSELRGRWPQYPRTIPALSIRKKDGRAQVNQTFDQAIKPPRRPPCRREHADTDRLFRFKRARGSRKQEHHEGQEPHSTPQWARRSHRHPAKHTTLSRGLFRRPTLGVSPTNVADRRDKQGHAWLPAPRVATNMFAIPLSCVYQRWSFAARM